MINKAHPHHNISKGSDCCQLDRREQILDLRQDEEGLCASGTKQDSVTSLEALFASLTPLEVASDIYSWTTQMVVTNSSPQTAVIPPEDKIIKTVIAYADNEDDPRRRTDNEKYRRRIEKILETISRHICRISSTLQEIAIQDAWKHRDDLEMARLVLLLVDDNFINTDYCCCRKLEKAILAHSSHTKYVIPIYMRPCILPSHLPLTKLHFLPSLQKPVSLHNSKDAAFQAISNGIENAVRDIRDNIL